MKGIASVMILAASTLGLPSCIEEKPLACTKALRSFRLTVNGGTLDDFYTIRESDGDTIRHGYVNVNNGGSYWVLDDRMNETLKGKMENFRFQGLINNEVVVDELFMFRGGPCHLEKVFGKEEVDI